MNTPRLVSLAIVVGVLGCGADEQPAHFDAPPDQPDAAQPYGAVTIDQLPSTLQDAVCRFEVRCGLMPDAATCAAVFDPATTDVAQLAAYVTAGKLTYDPDKAGTCLTSYRDAACTWTAGGLGPAPVCDEVFVGDKVEGVSCFLDEECTGALVCETAACVDGCCAGTCKARAAPAGLGADCSAGPCGDGAYCRVAGGTATCAEVAAAGATCTALDGCAAGSVCDLDPATAQGRCVALAAAGAACDPSVAVGSCAGIDQRCDPFSSTCEPRKAVGAACADADECVEAAACMAGFCAARPRPGEACGPAAAGGGCLGDLPCVDGVCTTDAIEAVCP